MILEKVYDELISQIEDLKKAVASMGGGSSSVDYETQVTNLPKVNNITLKGNKKSSDLKIAYSMTEAEYAAATKNAESIYCLQENATTFEEEDETASSSIEWSAGDPSGYVATWVYAPSNQNFTGCTAVECDDAAITVESFTVVEGNVQVYLSSEDTTQIGETVTFTFTLTQPAGSTRIVKNGITFGRSVTEIYSGSTDASSYELTQAITNFDEIVIQVTAVISSVTYHLYNTCPVSLLAADIISGARTGICSDDGYIYFTVTDTTHFAKAQNKSFYITKILGIKY